LPPAVTPVVSMVSLGLPVGATAAGGSALAASRDSSLPWLAVLWAIGAAVMLATQIWQQRRYRAGLGPLGRRPDGHLQSLATRGLPAVLGWRPRVVLPGDFEQQYSAAERELVLAHEFEHLRRR